MFIAICLHLRCITFYYVFLSFIPSYVSHIIHNRTEKIITLIQQFLLSVIVLSVNGRTVRDFMLVAESLGFINGEYVFVDVELFR